MLSRAYDVKEGQLCYDIDGGELTVVQGDEPYTGYIVIPKSVEVDGQQLSVTAIGQKAFNACLSLSGVKLPGTLRTIGQQAFASCPRLLSISLAEGLQTIGDAAFYGCRSLTEITIPASVTSIGDEAFVACSSLKAISVAQDNSNYSSLSGVLFSKDRLTLLAYPAGCDDIYSIPSGITTIGPWAFCHCANLEQVSLPSSVRRIGQASFYGCKKLSAIRLPAGLSAIGLWAFSECGSLRQVTLPASLEELGEGAFSFCEAMEGIYVEAGNSRFKSVDGVLLTADGTRVVAFPGGREGSYRLPSTVDSIGLQAFYGSNKLRSVTLPENLSRVASNPFVFCDGLEEILVDHANGSLSSRDGVLLSHDCTQLLYYPNARSGHYLMPEGITAIGHGSFLRSEGLSQLSLPTTLTEIDPWTFLDCTGLSEISLPAPQHCRHWARGVRRMPQLAAGGMWWHSARGQQLPHRAASHSAPLSAHRPEGCLHGQHGLGRFRQCRGIWSAKPCPDDRARLPPDADRGPDRVADACRQRIAADLSRGNSHSHRQSGQLYRGTDHGRRLAIVPQAVGQQLCHKPQPGCSHHHRPADDSSRGCPRLPYGCPHHCSRQGYAQL